MFTLENPILVAGICFGAIIWISWMLSIRESL